MVGETPNLAARLQALARPGTLVVADSTRRQIGTLFEIEDLGPQPLAGFAEPQRAWRVVGESGVVSRFEALRSGTTPLVGRDEELDLLIAALAAGEVRRRAGGAGLRRAGDRQVAPDRGAVATHRDRAAHPTALFLLTARSGQRALPLYRPAGARRGVRPRRHGDDESSTSWRRCSATGRSRATSR